MHCQNVSQVNLTISIYSPAGINQSCTAEKEKNDSGGDSSGGSTPPQHNQDSIRIETFIIYKGNYDILMIK
jgi:hypothetical protein